MITAGPPHFRVARGVDSLVVAMLESKFESLREVRRGRPFAPRTVTPVQRRQPLGGVPQGLRRAAAAAYIGVSPGKLDDWVRRDIMPKPKRRDGCVIWIRDELDGALRSLDDGDEASPYDEVAV